MKKGCIETFACADGMGGIAKSTMREAIVDQHVVLECIRPVLDQVVDWLYACLQRK